MLLDCLYIRELQDNWGWMERKTKCYNRVTFVLHSRDVWTVFEEIMLHGTGKEAIWGDFSVRMGVLLCEEYRGRQRRKEWLWERLFYRDTMWVSLFWLAFYFALLLNNYMFNISYIITILYICKQKEITTPKWNYKTNRNEYFEDIYNYLFFNTIFSHIFCRGKIECQHWNRKLRLYTIRDRWWMLCLL